MSKETGSLASRPVITPMEADVERTGNRKVEPSPPSPIEPLPSISPIDSMNQRTLEGFSTPSPPTGNLGRLESIFVTITKKIQTLEINQSVFDRYLSDIDLRYRRILSDMQKKQQSTTLTLENMLRIMEDLNKEVNEHVISKQEIEAEYVDALEKARLDNLKLQEELVVVRQVLTTMKAGIMVAVGLSIVVIIGFIIRLLLRCVSEMVARAERRRAKKRRKLCKLAKKHPRAYLNRSQTFGASLDDMAIRKNTLYRELVEDTNGFRKQYVWRLLSPSVKKAQ